MQMTSKQTTAKYFVNIYMFVLVIPVLDTFVLL